MSSTLVHKFHWSDERLADAFADFSDRLTHLSLSGRLHGVCRDPDDDLIIECAVMAGAEIIVTGDEDLLTIRKYRDIRILTPREFLDEFEARIGD